VSEEKESEDRKTPDGIPWINFTMEGAAGEQAIAWQPQPH
jgi:hypothetical protein